MTVSALSKLLAPNPQSLDVPNFPRGGRRRNYDDTPLIVGTYSVEEIKAFNAHHDRYYGWHPGFGNHYTNNARLPESFLGPASELWNR